MQYPRGREMSQMRQPGDQCGSRDADRCQKALPPGAGESLGEREPESLKGVLGLSSRDKTLSPLEKGILRAKHGINIFKDGTVRYDLTDLLLTHFRPDEICTSPGARQSLGYTRICMAIL